MSFLDQIKPEKRTLLASLPYRIGLYISQSDDAGGDESDKVEMQALDNIVTAYAQEVFGSENIQYIMSDTINRKDEWSDWGGDLRKVADECNEAVEILTQIMDDKEIMAFKRYLLEIGESVALAFREYGQSTPFLEKVGMWLAYGKSKKTSIANGEQPKQWEQFINISMSERKALQSLAHAMNANYV